MSDSDGGKSYNVKGTLNVDCGVSAPCGAWIDSCQNNKTLFEYYCDGTNLNDNFEIHNCTDSCVNGACV